MDTNSNQNLLFVDVTKLVNDTGKIGTVTWRNEMKKRRGEERRGEEENRKDIETNGVTESVH